MSSIPQGAFMSLKYSQHMKQELSQREKDRNSGNSTNGTEYRYDGKYAMANKKLMDYGPDKYNDKLMNSIWGLYNRYSPHNIKSNDYENMEGGYYLQQPLAVASFAIAQNLAMASTSCGKEWTLSEK